MYRFLQRFNRLSIIFVITLITLSITFVVAGIAYRFSSHEREWIDYLVLGLIPALFVPLGTWKLMAMLDTMHAREREYEDLLEALEKERTRLNESQRIAKIGSWYLNFQDNTLEWSEEIYHIFEIDAKGFRTDYDTFLSMVHPEDRESVDAAYQRSLTDRQPYHIEHRLLLKDGRVKHVREECVTVFDEAGKPLFSEGTVQDITEQVEAREENRNKELMLMQQSKMAQMGEMLNNVAHQWKQPLAQLNSIILDMEAKFQTNRLTDEYFHQKLDRIESLTTYMSDTIDQFKNYFDPGRKLERFDSQAVVDVALSLLEPVLRKSDIAVRTEQVGAYQVEGFRQEMIQVLLVLLSNAYDALMEKGVADPRIGLEVSSCDGRVCFRVRDNAGGIPPEIMERMFEPYFTTKSDRGGTGVGLYMAKMLVEKGMDGKLDFKTDASGTTFTVMI